MSEIFKIFPRRKERTAKVGKGYNPKKWDLVKKVAICYKLSTTWLCSQNEELVHICTFGASCILSLLMQCFNKNLIQTSLLFSTENDVGPSGILQEKISPLSQIWNAKSYFKIFRRPHFTVLNRLCFDHHIVNWCREKFIFYYSTYHSWFLKNLVNIVLPNE